MNELAVYVAYRIFTGLFGMLPEPVMRRLGESLGYLASFAAPARRRLVERHLGRVLGTDRQLRAPARRSFASYGRYWAEVFWMRPGRVGQLLTGMSTEGLEHVREARDAGKGIILALPHIGNWEAAGLEAVRQGVPVTAVAEALANRRIVDWFTRVRASFGLEVLLARRGVTATLEEKLLEGRTVALPCDRDIKGRGVNVEFFGEVTTLPRGPVLLALRTGAPVLPVGTYFSAGKGHSFLVLPPLDIPAAGSEQERLEEGTRRLARTLEDLIRRDPIQWHLFQPNWPSDREPTG